MNQNQHPFPLGEVPDGLAELKAHAEQAAPASRRWDQLKRPKGFLFIGDPHVSSVKPGKRTDDFTASVLGKLREAAKVARERELVPVILGDLIHRENENSVGLISRLMGVLREFPRSALEVDGNHGKHAVAPTPEDVEFLLDTAGLIELMDDPAVVREFTFGRSKVRLHVAPYGAPLPRQLPSQEGVFSILVCHHDLAFEGAYPGAQELFEIKGCDMVVNGHMHKTAPSIQVGQPLWLCPGNIEPLSVDVRHHKPAVWEWTPGKSDKLRPHFLAHDPECFNLVGRLVLEATSDEALADLEEKLKSSLFADLLSETGGSGQDADRTEEAAFLEEDLQAVLDDLKVSGTAAEMLLMLAADVSREAVDA